MSRRGWRDSQVSWETSAAAEASPASQRSTRRRWRATEPRPGSEAKRSRSSRRTTGANWSRTVARALDVDSTFVPTEIVARETLAPIVTLSPKEAPAVHAWLSGRPLRFGDLLRDPEDREQSVAAVVLAIAREDTFVLTPDDDEALHPGDQLRVAGTSAGLADVADLLFSSSGLEYAATGRQVPATWLFRQLAARRA